MKKDEEDGEGVKDNPPLSPPFTAMTPVTRRSGVTPKRSPSPAPRPSPPSSGKRGRGGGRVICSVLPDLGLFFDDVFVAAVEVLEETGEAEGNEEEDRVQLRERVVEELKEGVDRCEELIREKLWSVDKEVEGRAQAEVRRPLHTEEEEEKAKADFFTARQDVVNVRTSSQPLTRGRLLPFGDAVSDVSPSSFSPSLAVEAPHEGTIDRGT